MNHDRFPRLKARDGVQRLPCGDPVLGDGSRLDMGHLRRLADDHLVAARDVLSVGPSVREPKDLVAGSVARAVRVLDGAAELDPEYRAHAGRKGILSHPLHRIHAVDAERVDLHGLQRSRRGAARRREDGDC